jgi:tetratricopeptide (TPR) repeat protein
LSAEEPTSSSNESKPPSTRIEDILLERLKNEPEVAQQISPPILFAIIAAVLILGTAIFFLSRKPEKFAETPHQPQQQQSEADSLKMYSKRMALQPMIDSLQSVIVANPNDDQSHLMLANVYYECEFWDKAQSEYEYFLNKHPEDVDARVDYAYTLAQTTGDFKASIEEINKGLKYDPEHINALFNAGILTIRANLDDKKKAFDDAIPYFNRALAAAKKQHNDKMAEQIGKVMAELEKLRQGEKSEP